jgi:hypothetical protein
MAFKSQQSEISDWLSRGIVDYDAAKAVPAPRRGEWADGVKVDED